MSRRPVDRPALGGDGERLLRGLLGEVEVAEEADQGGEYPAPVLAEGVVEAGYHSRTGRISTAPPMLVAGTLAATSMAASRSSPSNMK